MTADQLMAKARDLRDQASQLEQQARNLQQAAELRQQAAQLVAQAEALSASNEPAPEPPEEHKCRACANPAEPTLTQDEILQHLAHSSPFAGLQAVLQ